MTPTDEQLDAVDKSRLGDLVVEAGAGTGKALRDDQRVLTPTGWTPIGDLVVGAVVVGADGRPCVVTGVYPQGVKPIFGVSFSDGPVVYATGDHLWETQTISERSKGRAGSVRTTDEIAATLTVRGGRRRNHYVPLVSPADGPDDTLPLDPYLLGALLGDGCLQERAVTITCPDAFVTGRVAATLPAGATAVAVAVGERCATWGLRGNEGGHGPGSGHPGIANPVLDILRAMGISNTRSHEKAIPDGYLHASYRQRLDLFHGLMDTDGHADGHTVEFSTASPMLAEQVVDLVRSFGGTATASSRPTHYRAADGSKVDCRTSYRLYIKLPAGVPPFSLPRKADRYIPRTKYQPWRQIVAIEPAGASTATCITVDGPRALFVTEGYVLTHNTSTLSLIAKAHPQRRMHYCAFNKALRWDQPVATPSGWTMIDKLVVGDEVFGPDGRTHAVTKVYDNGVRPMNLVVFSDGTEVVADDEHLWEIDRSHTGNATYVMTETVTTADIARHLTLGRRVRVPQANALSIHDRPLPVDPWLLGALLGDGSTVHRRVWMCTADPWVFYEVCRTVPAGCSVSLVGNTGDRNAPTFSVTGTESGVNPLLLALRDLGVAGQTNASKRVPPEYLWASAAQRLALLQGLMDTDGCVGAQSVTPIFATTSAGLADDVVHLAQSLGGTASKRLMRPATDRWKAAYQVTVRLPTGDVPFRFPGKADRVKPRTHDRLLRRRIVSVTPVAADRAVCISIDSPDHLYLTAGMIPTHNSIADEAGRKMPSNVKASTVHSLAYRAVGYQYRGRMNQPRMSSTTIAQILGTQALTLRVGTVGEKRMSPGWCASQVMKAIEAWCMTGDPEPTERHFGYVEGIDLPTEDGRRTFGNNREVAAELAKFLPDAWADLVSPSGTLPFKHSHYLKMWERGEPRIAADVILLDEAQDSNGVILSIIAQQEGAQVIMVGDENQAIYGWNGAIDAMNRSGIDNRARLTQSFRFGPAVADVANEYLSLLDTDLRLTGWPERRSTVETVPNPDCILTRTNIGGVRELFAHLALGERVTIVGGAADVKAFARAADQLATDGYTSHPELACFSSWEEAQAYADLDPAGSEIALMVKLVDEFGAKTIISALEQQTPERSADLVISTAHKAKGREWDRVRLADDFPDVVDPERAVPDEEIRLQYVAATRAQWTLDVDTIPLFNPEAADQRSMMW